MCHARYLPFTLSLSLFMLGANEQCSLSSQAASLYWNEANQRVFTKTARLWKLFHVFHSRRCR